VQLAVMSFAMGALSDVPLAHLRARQQSTAVVIASVSRLVLSLLLNIVFVVVLRLGVLGVLLSSLISGAVVGVLLAAHTFRQAGVRLVPSLALELLVFGAPLMAAQIGSFVLHFSDRYFLRMFSTLADVGLYSLAYKLAMVVATFVVAPFNSIWVPTALQVDREQGAAGAEILRGILRQYNIALITASLGVALFADDVIRVMAGPEFRGAAAPLPLLALSVVFFGYRQFTQVGSVIAQQSRYIAYSTTLAAIGVIVLNALLIPRWGIMGAAAATAAAFMLDFVVMHSLSERVYPLRFPFAQLLPPLAIAVVVWLVFSVLAPNDMGLLASVALHSGGLVTFGALLLLSGSINAQERKAIRNALRNPRATLRTLRRA
jgi:O-antigen/teichoic acid export membrane protein